jgi:7-carboxy-7-deazaguanine synthase
MTDEEKLLLRQGKLLPVMETFYSLQGEGFHTGTAAFFIRLGGCDVGCYWCDTRESWQADLHPLIAGSDIVQKVLETPARAVVITGGEPLGYNLDLLCQLFTANGIRMFLETSGSESLSGTWDWICLSPKKKAPPQPPILAVAHELKVIIFEDADFAWAELIAQQVSPSCLLYLQPEWSRRDKMMPEIVRYILDNPRWRISLQSHKYMRIP